MSNPNPVNPFPKNRKVRVGRKPGVPNNFTRELKEALLDAAEEVGEVEEEEIFDKDGESTGKFRRRATGRGGLKGYLKWAAVHRASSFIPQLGRIMPLQVNAKADVKPKRVPYRSYAEICDALRAKGIDPEVMERAMMPKFITDQKTIDVTAEEEPTAEGGEPKE
jgi:hypothetical protein